MNSGATPMDIPSAKAKANQTASMGGFLSLTPVQSASPEKASISLSQDGQSKKHLAGVSKGPSSSAHDTPSSLLSKSPNIQTLSAISPADSVRRASSASSTSSSDASDAWCNRRYLRLGHAHPGDANHGDWAMEE